MSDVKWIKIASDIFDDEKIAMIEGLPAADSLIVIWFKLLCLAGKKNNDGIFLMNDRIPYTDEMLASVFRRDVSVVRVALKTFNDLGMIEIVEGVITIPNWNKHQSLDALAKKRERDRLYQVERRRKQLSDLEKSLKKSSDIVIASDDKSSDIADESLTSRQKIAVLEREREEDKERDIDNIYIKESLKTYGDLGQSPCANEKPNANGKDTDAEELFSRLWAMYPKKKGKGQVSMSRKKALLKYGLEEMTRAIDRYKTAIVGTDERYIMHGSTFFNSGYIDYLDENYEEPQPKSGTADMSRFDAFANAHKGDAQ